MICPSLDEDSKLAFHRQFGTITPVIVPCVQLWIIQCVMFSIWKSSFLPFQKLPMNLLRDEWFIWGIDINEHDYRARFFSCDSFVNAETGTSDLQDFRVPSATRNTWIGQEDRYAPWSCASQLTSERSWGEVLPSTVHYWTPGSGSIRRCGHALMTALMPRKYCSHDLLKQHGG